MEGLVQFGFTCFDACLQTCMVKDWHQAAALQLFAQRVEVAPQFGDVRRHERLECGGETATVLFDGGDDLVVSAQPQGLQATISAVLFYLSFLSRFHLFTEGVDGAGQAAVAVAMRKPLFGAIEVGPVNVRA